MKIVLDSWGKDEIPSLTRNGMARVLEAYSLKEENHPLTTRDVSDLKSQIATSSWGEVRKSQQRLRDAEFCAGVGGLSNE